MDGIVYVNNADRKKGENNKCLRKKNDIIAKSAVGRSKGLSFIVQKIQKNIQMMEN